MTQGPVAQKTGMRRWVLRLTVLGASVVVSLILAELVVRFTSPQYPSWLDIFAREGDFPTYRFQRNVSRTINTGETNWTVYTDADGFRCGRSKPPADAPVLLVLGDSFAFGMGVDYDQSFPGIIQKRLGNQYRVLNTAVLGFGPTQYRQVLEYELAHGLNPKLVLVATYLGNDFHDCIWGKNTPVTSGILGNEDSARGILKRNSHLYRLISRTVHIFHEKTVTVPPHEAQLYQPSAWTSGDLARAYEIYRKEFATMADLCRARNIPLLVCILPTNSSVAHEGSSDYQLPATKAESVMQELKIPCVNATEKLAQQGARSAYFSWDMHFSPAGNQAAADAILAAMREAK